MGQYEFDSSCNLEEGSRYLDIFMSRSGGLNEQHKQLKSLKVGMKGTCCVDTEVLEKSILSLSLEESSRNV